MSTCYYPNGNVAQGGDEPCSDGKMCCPNGWSCQDNGLCFLENQNYLGRYTCTDKSWEDSSCPQICTSDTGAGGDEAILDCGDGYCCDHNRPDADGDSSLGCCETTTSRFQIENRQMVSGSDNGGSSSPTSSAAVSSSAAATSIAPPSSSSSTDDDDTTSTAAASATDVSFPFTAPVATYSGSSSSTQDAASSSTDGASSPTSTVDTNNNHQPSSHTSVILVTSIVTKAGGGSSTSVASHTSVIAEPASTSSPTPSKQNNLGAIIGPAVAVPVALIALAIAAFFFWRRRKQKKNAYNRGDHAGYEPQDPVDMYAAQKPRVPEIDSPEMGEKKSPTTTGPPSYRGVSGVPADDGGEAHGLGLAGNSELPGSPAFPPGGGPPPAQPVQPSELEGSTYLPYRPPRT